MFDTTFPAPLLDAKIEASANGVAFVVHDRRLHAVDLATGTTRFVSTGEVTPGSVAASDRLVFAGSAVGEAGSEIAGYDAVSGRRVRDHPERI